MQELSSRQVKITDPFWSARLTVNAQKAIFHQWKQLEATRCIDNFRLAAGENEGFREGWFFADSDAYKWLDAASRIYALHADPELASLMDSLISLIGLAQMPDGYIFTYNQLHFLDQRWVNLQVEHELYCHGHLIEAGVSHYEATGRRDLLDLCIKAADLLVHDFLNASNDKTCGHEEIELALIRLYRVTGKADYLELARQFVERRGRTPFYGIHWWLQREDFLKRKAHVEQLRQEYIAKHPAYASFRLPGDNYTKQPPFSKLRNRINALRGLYSQQHTPIRKQTVPVGHSVRFGYLETAIAMLCREVGKSDRQSDLQPALEQAWERMVTRRMYVTGGLGAAPGLEGFGNDYELDPEYAYAETCASLASLFWNWEMALITKDARYSDLFEWQLYNATNVGMGQDGDTYLYNNPLSVHQGVTRQGWYVVPCCPSNLSRTFADLGKYIYSFEEANLWIHQYIGSEMTVDVGGPVKLRIESELPWGGKVLIFITPEQKTDFALNLRMPSWAVSNPSDKLSTASGYDPRESSYQTVRHVWTPEVETLEFNFDMSIKLRRAHPKVRGHAGKVTITRGPLTYCLESVDNPDVDIFTVHLDPHSLRDEFAPDLLSGCVVIHAKTMDGMPLRFIPYFLWANRGESQMTVWVNSK
ncbi:MAG TPA: beta-L-arabinofuranosidase domain-containing protein [Anaerolineales bacterium]|nr:beta-L-arabinofuranosidase domain-containing protein [Anaerolineales bacterium]